MPGSRQVGVPGVKRPRPDCDRLADHRLRFPIACHSSQRPREIVQQSRKFRMIAIELPPGDLQGLAIDEFALCEAAHIEMEPETAAPQDIAQKRAILLAIRNGDDFVEYRFGFIKSFVVTEQLRKQPESFCNIDVIATKRLLAVSDRLPKQRLGFVDLALEEQMG